jgi:hypothetical protein
MLRPLLIAVLAMACAVSCLIAFLGLDSLRQEGTSLTTYGLILVCAAVVAAPTCGFLAVRHLRALRRP